MDYSGNVDYDVNTPFKYEGDDQDHMPPSEGGGGVDDPNKHMPVHHHHQDDLIYPPLDFATPTPQVVDTPHPVPSSSHLMGNQQSLDGNVSNSLGVTSDNLLPPSLVNSNTSVAMETSGNGDVSMEAMPEEHPPSSPESEDLPLARRTRPSRSTRPQKSFAEQDDEDEDEEYEQKPPKGLTNLYHEESAPTLVGGQSIFSSLIQKERRTRLTKGAKKKKKTEPEFCRFCFTNELSLQKIRTVKLPPTSPHATTKFTTLVPAVTDIALSLAEKWTNPSFQLVCDECVMVFASFYEFRQAVETNDQLLRRLYCKSKAKSKKPPATPATPTSAGKGKRRSNYKDPTSDDDSDARSTVSKRKTNRGRKKGVTDDEETDGYLSSVSKTSRKSTTSRRGGSKKKRGVTTDEDTDGYMSSVSRKSVNTTTSTAKNAKKKRRYNSDSDNEDVKSDVSDGMDFGPTAYESSDDISRESSISRSASGPRQDNHRPVATLGDRDNDDDDDNSDVDEYTAFNPNIVVKKEDGVSPVDVGGATFGNTGSIVVKSEPLGDTPASDGRQSRSRTTRRPAASDSDADSGTFGSHFLSNPQNKPASARTQNLKTVLESNLGTLVNKSSAKSQNYLAVIMKNYENRAMEPVPAEMGESVSDLEDKPLAKRKARSRKSVGPPSVKKENREKSCERKPSRRKSTVEDSDTDYVPEVEEEPPVERKKKEKREKKKKKKKEKIKREKATTGDEMSDFAFSSYESDSSESSMSERELFGPIIYKCRHCDVTFRTYELLLRHLTGKHGGFESAALCFICGFYHKHKKMIYRHIKEHIEPKKQEKKVCDICSAEVIHLGTHQKVAHSGVTYNCKFCSMKFTRVGQMNIHIKTVHLKHMLEKKFVCQYCNKEFPFQGYLNKHMKTHNHHGNGPGGGGHVTYTCKQCNLTFTNKHLFRNHKLVCGTGGQQQNQGGNTSAPNPLVPHPSTSSMSEQDVLQQQLQHSAQDTRPQAVAGNPSLARRRSLAVKSESDLDDGDYPDIAPDSENDDSDLDTNRTSYEPNPNFTDEESKQSGNTRGRGVSRRRKDTTTRSASVTKALGDLPKIVGKNLGLFTNSGKMASNYFDIVFKNRNTPVNSDATGAGSGANAEHVKVKEEKSECEDDKAYTMSGDEDQYSPDMMSDGSLHETSGGKRKRKRGRPKITETGRKPRKEKRKKKEKKDEKRQRLREELKAKMAEDPDKPVEFDGDLENLKFEADEFFDGEVPLYESSSDKEDVEEEEEMEEEVWQCRHCPLKHRSHDLLLRHYTKEHGGYDWASVCYYCGYFNGHKKMIYLHIKDHVAPKKREMKICDICCAEVLHLQQHQKAAHSGVCYDCTFCGKGFTRKAELNIHIKAVHLKHQLEQRFVCQYCNKDFPFMKYLKRHLRVHSNDVQVPHPYKCTACNAAFNTKSALNVHRKTCPNLELLNRDLLPNQTGTVTPEPPPQPPQQQMPPPQQNPPLQQQQRGGGRAHRAPPPAPPPPLIATSHQQPPHEQDEQQQLLLQNFIPNTAAAARDLISATNLREIQIGLALPPNAREIQIANTARELQLASTARELQLTNLSARDLQNLQNSKFERPQMYYY